MLTPCKAQIVLVTSSRMSMRSGSGSESEEPSWGAFCHRHLNRTKSTGKEAFQDASEGPPWTGVWINHECAFATDLSMFLLVHAQRKIMQCSYAYFPAF